LLQVGYLALVIVIAAVHGAATLPSRIVGFKIADLLLRHLQHLLESISVLLEAFALSLQEG